MTRLWHEASCRLRSHRRSASLTAAARLTVFLLYLLCGTLLQRLLLFETDFSGMPNLWDLFLPLCLAASVLFATPLRMQTVWELGGMSGLLDENDLGFLGSSSRFRLWLKAIRLRLFCGISLILSVMPALVLLIAAKSIWFSVPPDQEDLLPLLTVLHLLILAAVSLWLPLRVFAAGTAMPFCFLKMPHVSVVRIMILGFRVTRRQTAGILKMRLLSLPLLVFPFTALYALPTLLTAEMLRSSRTWRHLQPRRTVHFSGQELHAES